MNSIKGIILDKDGTLFRYGEVWGPVLSKAIEKGLSKAKLPDEKREECLADFYRVVGVDKDGNTYPDGIISTTPLAMYEYPAETTRAVVNMLARNVLVRYPNLKVVVPHCGSFLPLALPRMKSILPAMVKQGYMQPIDWEGNLSRLYFDLAGSPTAEVLRSLLTLTTPDHILYGSDYPYLPDSVLKSNLQRLRQTLAADKELAGYEEIFLWKNAERLFEGNATDERCPRT